MTRATSTPANIKRRKRVRKATEGFFGFKKVGKTALEARRRSLQYSFIGRKLKKRDFRSLWITRLNNASREKGLTYSKLIRLLGEAQIKFNRKQLSETAINQPKIFDALVKKIQNPW